MKTIRSIATISLEVLKVYVSRLPWEQWLPKRKSRRGQKGYSYRSLFLAYLLKLRENIPYDTQLARKLGENHTYREFCDFKPHRTPSHDTISRFIRKLTAKRLKTLILRLDQMLADVGVFNQDELAIDGTDVLSNGRNQHNPDPEAGYGYKSDKERFHGYWTVFVAGTTSEMLRAIEVTPANIHQSRTAQRLFRQLEHQDLRNATLVLADAAYDDKKTYARAIEMGLVPLISYNPKNAKIKSFDRLRPSNWRKRALGTEGVGLRRKYAKLRGAVERYQSTLKELLNGRTIPVRGLDKVTRYLYGVSILSQLYGLINSTSKSPQMIRCQMTLDDYFS